MTDGWYFSSLGARVVQELDAWTEAAAESSVGAVQLRRARAAARAATQRRQSRRRRSQWMGAGCGAALLIFFGGFLTWKSSALDVTVGVERTPYSLGDWASASAEELPLDFSDGSRVVLAPQTRARVVSSNSNGATVFVESGSVNVSVVPRDNSEWALSFGPFAVHVTGTEFDVAWDPEADEFELSLRHGSVSISGCVFGKGRQIAPNETVRASCGSRRYEVEQIGESQGAAASPSVEAIQVGPERSKPPVSRTTVEPVQRGAARLKNAISWQQLAEQGRYGDAFKEAERLGFEKQLRSLPAAELITLAGVARYAGRVDKSRQAYRAIRQRFIGSKQASAAAYSLARIAFDQQGAYSEAARWFATYLKEAPGAGLAREALGRQMEALQRAGQVGSAKRTAQAYLAKYPDGPHAALARSMVASSSQ